MKRILLCLPLLLLLMVCPAHAARLDMRGVWVSTVYNLDWPSRPGLSESQLKAEADEHSGCAEGTDIVLKAFSTRNFFEFCAKEPCDKAE